MTSFKTSSAGYLANHVARLFARELAEAVRPLGLAPAQFMVLLELWREDRLTQKDLVGRLDVEQATMAATLARMERDGLIERRPDQADARARRIQLTARARALQAPALAAAKGVNTRALAGFSEAEREVLLSGLRRIVGLLSRSAELG
ncbi:MarR family transcriptional regulator [Bosea sp. 62]|uniref:MarR family winged helix-turn-helix transcriptional regulator n=1 Tax=unclassified Bosea (in: a-proteobacteria) TaxID=2653178 RepID=UPI0012595AF1|nr:MULTISPECIES: MarR family transcriptional regulator [unclassified Bosea (in: a-proteobacteria)]CAD5286799.1 MarR family transcriptional regulator [Bosea sp. 21B]CAD5289291.1 MarR family transcriptional regulator [Bosea sp. 46]CAD5301204.1 MarR family transcriptional regulator [Bosea sp. 7B]VVT60530.1 MarR family transcriptional regulator [Bosea sp. EC-HK365B]VXB03596.1 MarR family transcriptional regulator [Bosea sp. 62]